MSLRPEDLLQQIPAQFRWGPGGGIRTDPIDMEFLIARVEDSVLRDKLTAVRLNAVAEVLRIAANAHAEAAKLIASQR
jgi:hypothetical protein